MFGAWNQVLRDRLEFLDNRPRIGAPLQVEPRHRQLYHIPNPTVKATILCSPSNKVLAVFLRNIQ